MKKIIEYFKLKKTKDGHIEFFGEFVENGLNQYSTYEEIKRVVIEKIVEEMGEDIHLIKAKLREEITETILKRIEK